MTVENDWVDKNLPNVAVKIEDINLYLSYEHKVYEAMSPEELYQVLLDLKKYSLEVKIKYNKEKAKARWLYSVINKMAKPECQQYASYDKDERLYSVIKSSDTLKKYLEAKLDSEYKSNLLDGVEKEINNLAFIIKNLYDYKVRKVMFEKGVKENDDSDA